MIVGMAGGPRIEDGRRQGIFDQEKIEGGEPVLLATPVCRVNTSLPQLRGSGSPAKPAARAVSGVFETVRTFSCIRSSSARVRGQPEAPNVFAAAPLAEQFATVTVWYGMVNVDLYSAIITKVSNALNTLVSGEKPGFQALSKGLIVLLCAEVVRQGVPDHGAVHSECSASNSG